MMRMLVIERSFVRVRVDRCTSQSPLMGDTHEMSRTSKGLQMRCNARLPERIFNWNPRRARHVANHMEVIHSLMEDGYGLNPG